MKQRYIVSILSVVLFFLASSAQAARLYFDPQQNEFGAGDVFALKARIDTEGECINTVKIDIGFPINMVKALDISRGESILSLIIEEPAINPDGIITLTGGIPGGYCGRIAGDPGLTNVLAEIVFQVNDSGIGKPGERDFDIIYLSSSQVFLNDGLGTIAKTALERANVKIVKPLGTKDKWTAAIKNDKTPPEPFSVELAKDGSLFSSKYFVAFSTTDKQSGLDHYEVQETDRERLGYVRGSNKESIWKSVKSPYLLLDQSLNSIIKIKAVDKAGNERIVSFLPDASLQKNLLERWLDYILPTGLIVIIAVILLFSLLTVFYVRKARKKKENNI